MQAAVAVRDAPGSCQLKDIAMLQPGDTFGESSLLVGLHLQLLRLAVFMVYTVRLTADTVSVQLVRICICHSVADSA